MDDLQGLSVLMSKIDVRFSYFEYYLAFHIFLSYSFWSHSKYPSKLSLTHAPFQN